MRRWTRSLTVHQRYLIALVGISGFLAWYAYAVPGQLVLATPAIEVLPPHAHVIEHGASTELSGHVEAIEATLTVPADVRITGARIVLHNVPQEIVHHIVVYSEEGEDTSCPGQKKRRTYYGYARDTTYPYVGPSDTYAFYVPKGTVIHLNAMFHNPDAPRGTGETYRDVRAEVILTTAPVAQRRLPIYREQLALEDGGPCTDSFLFTVPPATTGFVRQSEPQDAARARYVVPEDGTITASGAHTHGWSGGKDVTLFHNGEPVHTWTTELLEESGTKRWITRGTTLPFSVKRGDTLTLSATYDNPERAPILDAMGMITFYYAPD